MKSRVNFHGSWYATALLIVLCLTGRSVRAQELRDPNAQEKAILTHYRQVINKVLDQFRSDDWEETVDYEIGDDVSVSSDPDVPLDVNEMFQRSYVVRRGSALYQKEIAPFEAKLASTTDPYEMAKIAKQRKMWNFSVEVHFNRLNVGVDPPPASNADLHVPGTAQAYRIKPYKFEKGTSVVLLFGNWKAATWDASNGWEHYKFKHAAHQPAIENIEIQLDGSPDRIDQLLHSVNWPTVNDALTEKL